MSSPQHLFCDGYDRAIRYINERRRNGLKTAVFTPNVEMLSLSAKDENLKALLKRGDLLLPDGIGVYLAARLSGCHPKERTNGIDLAERLMRARCNEMTLFLIGAKPGIAKRAAIELQHKCPSLRIVGTHHGYFSETDSGDVIKMIDRSGANTLFVCLGFPRQEKWIAENMPKLKSVDLAIGLGGSLDVWSGSVRRAPKLFRACGLEWLWRIIIEPRRIARILNLLK